MWLGDGGFVFVCMMYRLNLRFIKHGMCVFSSWINFYQEMLYLNTLIPVKLSLKGF